MSRRNFPIGQVVDSKLKGEFLLNPGTTRTQYGALCWRMRRGKLEILLVTSRDTSRWIIPKGWPMPDRAPEQAAAQEAWEEAGARGDVAPDCVGLFPYNKVIGPDLEVPCLVAVYPLRVERLADRFPERKMRSRKWFPAEKAAAKVAEPELQALIAAFQPIPLPKPDAVESAGS